jgi:extradiol dioxygenase family protein
MSRTAHKSIVEAQPLIAVHDVRVSSRWYRELLGAESLPEHDHRSVYDRISQSGRVVLQLHAWETEDHPNLVNSTLAPVAHGVVLWFLIADFDAALTRVRGLNADVIQGPFVNPAPQHREIWLRDPDGFVVVLASLDGECAP